MWKEPKTLTISITSNRTTFDQGSKLSQRRLVAEAGVEPAIFSLPNPPLNGFDEADEFPLLYPASATTGIEPDLLIFRETHLPNMLSVALKQKCILPDSNGSPLGFNQVLRHLS